MAIACVGSCNIDLIAYTDRFPAPGETIIGTGFQKGLGGKGANQCVMAAKLAGPGKTAMVAAVGDDSFGTEYTDALKALDTDVSCVTRIAGQPTGVAPIWVNASGENSIIVVPGANNCLTPDAARTAVEGMASTCKALLLQLEVPHETTLAALKAARARGISTILTPAPAPPAGLADAFFAHTDILVPNRGELVALAAAAAGTGTTTTTTSMGGASAAGASTPIRMVEGTVPAALHAAEEVLAAGRRLLAGGCGAVVVTLGGTGSLALTADAAGTSGTISAAFVPAAHVGKVVDTTGAGDAFAGSLAFFYQLLASGAAASGGAAGAAPAAAAAVAPAVLHSAALHEAVRRASYTAAISVTRRGTQASYPAREELPPALLEARVDATAALGETLPAAHLFAFV